MIGKSVLSDSTVRRLITTYNVHLLLIMQMERKRRGLNVPLPKRFHLITESGKDNLWFTIICSLWIYLYCELMKKSKRSPLYLLNFCLDRAFVNLRQRGERYPKHWAVKLGSTNHPKWCYFCAALSFDKPTLDTPDNGYRPTAPSLPFIRGLSTYFGDECP